MKKSIFSKLLLMNIAVVTAALLVIALLLPQFISGFIFTQKERELTAKGKELARLTQSYYEGRISDENFLELLLSLDQFLEARIWLVNRDGVVIKASYGEPPFRRGPQLRLSEEHLKRLSSGESVVVRHYLTHFKEVMLSVGVPIMAGYNAEPVGAIFLHAPVTEITATVNNLVKFVLLSGLAAVCLASLIGYIFSRRLSRPLQEMTEAARRMGQGEYTSRIKINSEDELGQLAFSLNYLAGRLEKTITALQREKRNFESMVTGMLEGVIGINSAGELIYVNAAAKEMLQLDDTAVSRHIGRALPTEQFAAPFLKTLAGGRPETGSVEFNGNHYSVHVSPVEDETGSSPGAVGLIQDVSETARLEAMRREFIANVSHELRTPLTILGGYSEALLDGTADSTQKTRFLKIIRAEIERLDRLITDLLDLSRLQARRIELHKKEFDFKKLALELKTRLMPRLELKRIDLVVDVAPKLKLWGDRDRIMQVLLNLVENAIRHSPEDETINLLAQLTEEQKVEVSIQDRGPGMAAEDLPHIWERFYRVDKSRDRRQGGTGLGLAITREIIEAHDGTVSVQSIPGKGSRFSFTLPLP
ncbi:MAG: ATP-binding protein [Bacillota bacterium]